MGEMVSLHLNPFVELLTPRTQNVTVFGDKIFPEAIKLK